VHRRASSLEPTYRGGSPAPRGRGVSLDRGAGVAGRGQRPASSHLAQVSEEDDPSRSVNFSRPMSPGAPGTRQNPSPPTSHGWFGGPLVNQAAVQHMAATSRPKTSSGVSSYDLQNASRSVQSASERPVRTHQIAQGVQGLRLNSGSMRAKPSGTAVQSQSYLPRQAPQVVDPNSPNAVYDPSTRKFIHKQDAMARHRELHEEPEPARQHATQHVDSFHSVHIPENQMGRGSPSPVRHYVRQEQPAPQRRAEPTPRVETSTRSEPYPGAGTVPLYSDDFADADVQPQEQANTSRKLEDSGYGTVVGQKEDVSSPIVAANQDSAYPRLPPPANTLAGQGRGSIRAGHDRNASLSPPRSAHFAPVAVELTGLKHDPLPRSVSPAKSALKASPSVSRRGESPMAPNGRLHSMTASSEVSDATSDEGGRKKKKTVRVSFEEEPAIAGTAAHADTLGGLSQSRWSPIAEKENEFDDFMKPRAALPVFGSIRGKERRPHEDMAEKVTETVPITSSSASASTTRDPPQASTDMAIGNIIAHNHGQKQSVSTDPLPPEVTSVEGSGYASDSASEYLDTHKQIEHTELLQQPPAPEPKSLSAPTDVTFFTPAPITERVVEVPNIALQPATPSPYEKPEPKFQSMVIPGGWGDDDHEADTPASIPSQTMPSQLTSAPSVETIRQQPQPIVHAEEDDTTDDNSSVYSDAYEDLSDGEGGFGSINALMSSPAAPSSTGLMYSKYADKSATDNPSSKLQVDTFADDDRDSTPTPTQDWNAAQQHWSVLSASLKQPQQAEPPAERVSHAQETIARVLQAPAVAPASISSEYSPESTPERKVKVIPPPRITTPSATPQANKPLKSALKKSPVTQPTRQVEPQPPMTTRIAAPREGLSSDIPQMKKTMRGGPSMTAPAAQQTGSTMRSSMRGAPDAAPRAQSQMKKSMRSADASPAPSMGLAASRHSMVPMDTKPPRGALQKRNIPPAAAVAKPRPRSMPAAKQTTAPVPTYDSDSDASASSFQRTRKRGSRDQAAQYTMRGSMRQEPAPTMRANAPAPRQVRAISPPRAPSPALRRSMRPSSPIPEPVKSSKFSIRSLSPMGRFRKGGPDVRPSSPTQPKPMPTFNKQSKASKQKAPAAKPAKAAFSSRFADSSDDSDDRQPRRFQSRFDDSDDDEPIDYKLPPGLTPVRGIPRKAGEEDGDSTDLEEEADDESPNVAPRPATATNGTNGNANGQGAALSAGSLRDSKHAPALPSFGAGDKTKKKRGFFGLGKKKDAQPEPTHTQADLVQPVSTPDEIPMPPTQRNSDMGLPMTPIDEDREFGDPAPIFPASKKSPKLQRRTTPEWPLPPVPAIGTDERPMSSDGVTPRRPRFANRQSSVLSNVSAPIIDAQGRSVSYGRSGKKKKFQGLRRVFGLND
jgi:serine/arginine repetitive matrix protein 2